MAEIDNPGSTPTPEQIAAIEQRFAEVNELADVLPLEASVSRDLLYTYAVYIDENGAMEVPKDVLEEAILGAIVRLDKKVVEISARLDAAGL